MAKNLEEKYFIENMCLADCERDLGVLVSSDLKWKAQVKNAVGKANRILGMLRRAFVSRDVSLWSWLYSCLDRPHLELLFKFGIHQHKEILKILRQFKKEHQEYLSLCGG